MIEFAIYGNVVQAYMRFVIDGLDIQGFTWVSHQECDRFSSGMTAMKWVEAARESVAMYGGIGGVRVVRIIDGEPYAFDLVNAPLL